MTGCHQPSERFTGTRHSVRLVRARPAPGRFRRSVQSARGRAFLPEPAPGADRPSSNDVTIDRRGLVYLVDRLNGVDVIEAGAFS